MMKGKRILVVLVGLLGLLLVSSASPVFGQGGPSDGQIVPGKYIVLVADGHDPAVVASDHGVPPRHVFRTATNGFASDASPGQVDALRADDRVLVVENERIWHPGGHCVSEQCLPTGIGRIETDKNPSADVDSTDDIRVGYDIAMIDTGIDGHPDLNVAGGRNFTSGPPGKWDDTNGHGTHTAGTAAAIDNGTGVVGVAPGARLWAIRVCKNGCFLGDMIAGINWVAERKSEANDGAADGDPGINFAVASMSISHQRQSTECGEGSTALHLAFCGLVETGVVATLSAGNSPKSNPDYPEVLQVAAMADFDGKGGAAATTSIEGCSVGGEEDDSLADFSTFGADIAAPGWCIFSTYKDGGFAWLSGTSMAAPHVGGAVALYLHANGLSPATDGAGVDAIEAAILSAALPEGIANHACSYNNERGSHEPMLFVNATTFGGDGTCDVAAGGGGGGNTAPDAVIDFAEVDEGGSVQVFGGFFRVVLNAIFRAHVIS